MGGLYEGAEITAEVLSYEDYIERSSTKETIDSDGEAQFVVTGKKAGTGAIKFSTGSNESVKVLFTVVD